MNNFTIVKRGTSIDLTNHTQFGTLVLGERADEAFGQGSVQVLTNLVTTNIPPYTLANINGESYFVESECTKYQTKAGYYAHNVSIIELTAILECFILGTKVESTGNDRTKLGHIIELVEDKYNLNIIVDSGVLTDLEGESNDYVFGTGTTLFEVMTQFLTRLNQRPKVTSFGYTLNSDTLNITISSVQLDASRIATTLDSSRITQHTLSQQQDNYCKHLETEANNVVDRNNLTYDKFLCEKNYNEARLTEDNGKLYTTNRIERVDKFEVNQYAQPYIGSMFGSDWFFQYITGYTQIDGYIYNTNAFVGRENAQTLREWIEDSLRTGDVFEQSPLYLTAQSYCNAVGIDLFGFLQTMFYVASTNTQGQYVKDGVTATDWYFRLELVENYITVAPYDITDHILVKEEYDAIEVNIQPKYCYYSKGSNIIDGLHVIRNNDLWGIINSAFTGAFRGPMMDDVIANYSAPTVNINGTGPQSGETFTLYGSPHLNARVGGFNVKYVAYTNPVLVDTKTDTPFNEDYYKQFSRSYGVSASEIDFNKIVDSMAQNNEMLGKPELIIDYDITGLQNNQIPFITQKIKDPFTNQTFYLMSLQKTFRTHRTIMTLSLCSSYYKVAQAIGVAYQYNATRLAIEGIVERPIHIQMQPNQTLPDENLYLHFTFRFANNTTKEILSRASYMQQGDKIVLYCEAMDQYAFGYNIVKHDNYDFTEAVTYGDDNNEIVSMDAGVYVIPVINPNELRLLPDWTAANMEDFVESIPCGKSNILIYKDAREKLTFTIEIERSN